MAAVVGSTKQIEHALPLFEQAQTLLPDDIDFAVDYARTIGMAAVENRNAPMLAQALAKFAQLHQRAPEHTLNLQNWAIVLFYQGEFAQAWQKIKLAEATSQAKDLDPRFIKDLAKKMARP